MGLSLAFCDNPVRCIFAQGKGFGGRSIYGDFYCGAGFLKKKREPRYRSNARMRAAERRMASPGRNLEMGDGFCPAVVFACFIEGSFPVCKLVRRYCIKL